MVMVWRSQNTDIQSQTLYIGGSNDSYGGSFFQWRLMFGFEA